MLSLLRRVAEQVLPSASTPITRRDATAMVVFWSIAPTAVGLLLVQAVLAASSLVTLDSDRPDEFGLLVLIGIIYLLGGVLLFGTCAVVTVTAIRRVSRRIAAGQEAHTRARNIHPAAALALFVLCSVANYWWQIMPFVLLCMLCLFLYTLPSLCMLLARRTPWRTSASQRLTDASEQQADEPDDA